MHASERYDTVQDRLRDASDELDAARERYVCMNVCMHVSYVSYVYICIEPAMPRPNSKSARSFACSYSR